MPCVRLAGVYTLYLCLYSLIQVPSQRIDRDWPRSDVTASVYIVSMRERNAHMLLITTQVPVIGFSPSNPFAQPMQQ